MSEPVEYQYRTRPDWIPEWNGWNTCSKESAEAYEKNPYLHDWHYEVRRLYTIPPQPWEKFCDSNCAWTDHHPDCKLAEQEREACAKISETPIGEYEVVVACGTEPTPSRIPQYANWQDIAKAIRSRGQA